MYWRDLKQLSKLCRIWVTREHVFRKFGILQTCNFAKRRTWYPKLFHLLNFLSNKSTGGRCYDHNFLRFLPIFCEKKLAFFSKTNIMIKNLQNIAVVLVKRRQYFRRKYFQNHNIGPGFAKAPKSSINPRCAALGCKQIKVLQKFHNFAFWRKNRRNPLFRNPTTDRYAWSLCQLCACLDPMIQNLPNAYQLLKNLSKLLLGLIIVRKS
jgi:hypothetical protein